MKPDIERTDVLFNVECCPHCGAQMSALFTVDKREGFVAGAPSTVIVCHHCTGVSIVDHKSNLIAFTEEIVRQMDPSDLRNVRVVVAELRRRKMERGEMP